MAVEISNEVTKWSECVKRRQLGNYCQREWRIPRLCTKFVHRRDEYQDDNDDHAAKAELSPQVRKVR